MNMLALTLLVGLLAPFASCVPASAPSPPLLGPVCGFQGLAGTGTTQNFENMALTINGKANAGAVALSILSVGNVQSFVIDIAFDPTLYVPVPSKTVVQYTFLEGTNINLDHPNDTSLQSWTENLSNTCVPGYNGLYYFTKFGEVTGSASFTLNPGTVVSFPDSQSMRIVNPIIQAKLPWTNNPTSSALCLHSKPGGIYLIMGIYNKDTYQPNAGYPYCGYEMMPETAYMNFTLACSCPAVLNINNPPSPARSPPMPPSPPTPINAPPKPPSPPPMITGYGTGICSCLPYVPVFVAPPVSATYDKPTANADTTKWTAGRAANESICVALAASNADIATAAALVVYTATVAAAVDKTQTIVFRRIATSKLVSLTANILYAAITAAAHADYANLVANDVSIVASPTSLQIVQVAKLVQNVAQSDLLMANAAYIAASGIDRALSVYGNDATAAIITITTAQAVLTAGHRAALAVAIAGHEAACAVHVAALAASVAVQFNSAPDAAAAAKTASDLADATAMTALHAADITSANALLAADGTAANALKAALAGLKL